MNSDSVRGRLHCPRLWRQIQLLCLFSTVLEACFPKNFLCAVILEEKGNGCWIKLHA